MLELKQIIWYLSWIILRNNARTLVNVTWKRLVDSNSWNAWYVQTVLDKTLTSSVCVVFNRSTETSFFHSRFRHPPIPTASSRPERGCQCRVDNVAAHHGGADGVDRERSRPPEVRPSTSATSASHTHMHIPDTSLPLDHWAGLLPRSSPSKKLPDNWTNQRHHILMMTGGCSEVKRQSLMSTFSPNPIKTSSLIVYDGNCFR